MSDRYPTYGFNFPKVRKHWRQLPDYETASEYLDRVEGQYAYEKDIDDLERGLGIVHIIHREICERAAKVIHRQATVACDTDCLNPFFFGSEPIPVSPEGEMFCKTVCDVLKERLGGDSLLSIYLYRGSGKEERFNVDGIDKAVRHLFADERRELEYLMYTGALARRGEVKIGKPQKTVDGRIPWKKSPESLLHLLGGLIGSHYLRNTSPEAVLGHFEVCAAEPQELIAWRNEGNQWEVAALFAALNSIGAFGPAKRVYRDGSPLDRYPLPRHAPKWAVEHFDGFASEKAFRGNYGKKNREETVGGFLTLLEEWGVE